MYCDVVGSTELSGRQELETYRELMRGYRDAVPRRDREPLRRPHRPDQGRRGAVDLRLPGRARERRRAGGARRARTRAGGAGALPGTTATAGESLDLRVGDPPRPRVPRLRRGRHLRPRRQRRRAPAGARRSGHGRRLRRGPAACRGLLRARGVRAPAGQGRGRAPRAVPGRSANAPLPPQRSWSTPLVEREDELARLRRGLGARRRRRQPVARRAS